MNEEWAVVIVEGRPLDTVATSAKGEPALRDEPQRMVGICPIGQAAGQPLTICDDEAEAFRVAQAVSEQLHLPLYDGVDRQVVQVDAGEYVDLEADGPDPYTEHRNVTNRWAVVMAHDERYAKTDFPCIVNLDDWIYEPEYIVSQHPTEEAAYSACAEVAAKHGLPFPVEPGQFSVDVPASRYRPAVNPRIQGPTLRRFLIHPDRWRLRDGPEPSAGPIEAPDARTAYRLAASRGMYPAGEARGIRVVALDDWGHPAPERGVWGDTQETPEWAAYERAVQAAFARAKEVRPETNVPQASAQAPATEDKEATDSMKIEARNMKLMDGDRTDNLLAVCDLNLGGDYVVQGVRVLKSSKDGKAFVSLPAYQDRSGDYHEVAHPVTAKAREVTNQVVLKEYERQVLAKIGKVADGPER